MKKSFTLITTTFRSVKLWRIHRTGCQDIRDELRERASRRKLITADNAKEAAYELWEAAELREKNPCPFDVLKIMRCAVPPARVPS